MRKRDYDDESYSGGTETHLAADTQMKETIRRGSTKGDRNAYHEGFASASGVRQETAETGGRIHHPESKDAPRPDPVPPLIEKENAGLADTADE
ncbi:MAG: hypothetical protein KGJ06_04015 [Pseudomonadota bacterium]|nr:hypothetical protein [Pseudomonadota bacterium]